MEVKVKPIFLFADSQILFLKNKDRLFLNRISEILEENKKKKKVKPQKSLPNHKIF